MLLIGFGHRARQGKNTAALAVLEACPLETQVRVYAYADALRAEVLKAIAMFGGQDHLIRSWKEAGLMPDWVHTEFPKPRSVQQWWGTEYRRAKDPRYWIKKLNKTLADHKPEVAAVADVRFPNEGDDIHEQGGYLVKVVNTGKTDVDVHEHESESAMDDYKAWDYFIHAATAEDCKTQATAIFQEIVRKRGGLVIP